MAPGSISYRVLASAQDKAPFRERVQTLFLRSFGRPLTDQDWEHFIVDAPYEGGFCVVALDGERVVATANFIPQRLRTGDRIVAYYFFTTSMVDPDYRNLSIYLRTTRTALAHAKSTAAAFVLALPNPVALELLTRLFSFRPLQEVAIVSMTSEEADKLPPLPARSIVLDDGLARWRFAHRDYFRVVRARQTWICKSYGDSIDVVEALEEPPLDLSFLPDRSDLPRTRVNVIHRGGLTVDPASVVARWQAVCHALTDEAVPGIECSLLMSDVV